MRKTLLPVLMMGLLFAVFGFAAWLNSILIPYFQIALELSNIQTTLVTFSFFIAYVVMSMPSAWLLKKIGFRYGLVTGLIIMAVGALLFVPAAHYRAYWLFLTGLFIMGSGQALLQTGANPYVTILGPIESGARRNSFMGVCNKLAGIASQRLLGPILLMNADLLLNEIRHMNTAEKVAVLNDMIFRVVNPYWLMAASLIAIAVIMMLVKLPTLNEEEINADGNGITKKSIWMYPNLVLGVITLFAQKDWKALLVTTLFLMDKAWALHWPSPNHLLIISFMLCSPVISVVLFLSQNIYRKVKP